MDYELETVSSCCGAAVEEHEKKNGSISYWCVACELECDPEERCAYCGGSGEVETMEQVYPGEPHMAPIGTATCVCKLPAVDEEPFDPEK